MAIRIRLAGEHLVAWEVCREFYVAEPAAAGAKLLKRMCRRCYLPVLQSL